MSRHDSKYNRGTPAGRQGEGRKPSSSRGNYAPRKQVTARTQQADAGEEIRLNRYIANSGICSRREADTFIAAGSVSVNGQVITQMGFKVKRSDEVLFDGKRIVPEKSAYILLNKPKGYITTVKDEKGRHTVMELIHGASSSRVVPVGRLDRNTTGLLLLTNDGELAKKLTHPKYGVEKIYHVGLDRNLGPQDFKKIEEGVELEEGLVKVDDIAWVEGSSKREVGIAIHSGRNRVVRRLFEKLGYEVSKLDRVVFAGLTKKKLPRGQWRHLSEQEVANLKMLFTRKE